MRLALGTCVLVIASTVAQADTAKLVKQYSGRVVISPDAAPTLATELPAHVKANAVAGDHYELVKGPPWVIHIVGFLAKDPGAATVQLVLTDVDDKQAEPVVSVDVATKNRLVITKTEATTAAGFVDNHTYLVRLMHGKTVLAKAELKLRN
ncbi:MAG TPA: hypothetical protein VFQ53_19115 [Kofleriaceae bacterium]|nr:hypothetical protein [Kofleriaceae bacterium]